MERIRILFSLAWEAASEGDLEFADYYVDLAYKIGMRVNTPLPKDLKALACRNCRCFLQPGVTSRVRLDSERNRVDVKCLRCGGYMHYPYVKEKRL